MHGDIERARSRAALGVLETASPPTVYVPEGDIRATRYSRSSLSHELDTENIEASLKDGVLRLRTPKRAEVRPRRIRVSVG
jgi:hypothetical protein